MAHTEALQWLRDHPYIRSTPYFMEAALADDASLYRGLSYVVVYGKTLEERVEKMIQKLTLKVLTTRRQVSDYYIHTRCTEDGFTENMRVNPKYVETSPV